MRSFFTAVLALSLCAASAKSEEGTPPDALYAAAFHSQGLYFSGARPWHLKASYTIFDAKGGDPVKGVFEEWWVSPHKYKLSYTRPGFMQTDYSTEAGLYRVGEQKWPSGQEVWIPSYLFAPLPALQDMKEFSPQPAEFNGNTKLRCVTLMPTSGPSHSFGSYPTFCFENNSPVLRLNVPYGANGEIIFNRIQSFQGHFVAGEIETNQNGKTVLKLEVDTLEIFRDAGDTLLAPPSDAVHLPQGPVPLSQGSLRMIQFFVPVYPKLAEVQRVEGKVVAGLTIGRDGHVKGVRVISGPRMYQQTAMETARQWIYTPYLLGGEPVEVDMQTEIEFKVGR